MPNPLNNVRIAVKLPLLIVALCLVILAVQAVTTFIGARDALVEEGKKRLTVALEARTALIGGWIEEVGNDLTLVAADPVSDDALRAFDEAFRAAGGSREAVLGGGAASPGPEGDRQGYAAALATYGDRYRGMLRQHGFDDLMIVTARGDVVYSVMNKADFATNVRTGAYRETELGVAVAGALAEGADAVTFTRFARYDPSDSAPASFAAVPIADDGGRTVGVLVAQLGIGTIDEIMNNVTGLGETGQTYLVGPDNLMRSNSRFASSEEVLRREVRIDAVELALKGEAGVTEGTGLNGNAAALAYQNLSIGPMDYAVVAEVAMEEITRPAIELEKTLLLQTLVAAVVVGVVSMLLGRSISVPIGALNAAMTRIAARDFTTDVTGTARRDEIGAMSRVLSAFRDELRAGEAIARDAAFKGAAFETCSAALIMVDPDLNIVFVNRTVEDLLEASTDDLRKITPDFDARKLVGRNIDVFHAVPARQRAILSDPRNLPYRTEIMLGQRRMKLSVSEVRTERDGVLGLVVEWQDVTADRLNGAILASLNARQIMAQFDPSGRLVEANDNFRQLLGADVAAFAGRSVDDILAAPDGTRLDLLAGLSRGEAAYGRFAVRGAAGRTGIIDGGLSPIAQGAGRLDKVILIANDITAAETSLAQAEASRKALEMAQARVVELLRVGLRGLSEGDLTTRIDADVSAEYESLRADFNMAAARLSDAIAAVVDNAASIRREAQEMSGAADDLSRRTEQQAATLEETAAALDELTASVQSTAAGAKEASRVVESARSSAEASGGVVQDAVEAMGEIDAFSDRISRIIGVIDDIAFQTNLLALNAGVEAARAGEAGRGFAVVASEVRALAQRSSDAAREINDLISASADHVKRGVTLVGEAGAALRTIVASVTDIAGHVTGIAAAAQEQSVGLAEINTAVNQLDQVTQQNAAMFEETSAASAALTREAEGLAATTSRFRVTAGEAAAPAGTAAPFAGRTTVPATLPAGRAAAR